MGGIGTNQQKHRQKQKKYIPEVLGMGGIGTKQKKNRKNKKKNKKTYSRGLGDGGVPPRVSKYFCFLFFFGFLDVFWFSGPKMQKPLGKPKKNKKHNIPEILAIGGSHQEFPNIVFFLFFGFLNVFLISLHGVLPKETQSIFLCYHYMEVYTVFFLFMVLSGGQTT